MHVLIDVRELEAWSNGIMGCPFQGSQLARVLEWTFYGCTNRGPGTRPTLCTDCRKGHLGNSTCLMIENRLMSVDEAMYVHISSSPSSHQIQIQKGKNSRIRILYSVNFREPLVHVINRLSVNLMSDLISW